MVGLRKMELIEKVAEYLGEQAAKALPFFAV